VLAAPRFLGRPTMAAALTRFRAEGAWGVSPHLIPHRCLHSLSGTVSQALQVHGPNFGVGGGPGGEAEALRAALALLTGQRLPGVWVVLTRLDPELPPDGSGLPPPGSSCAALALALAPARPGWAGVRVRLLAGGGAGPNDGNASPGAGPDSRPELDLFHLQTLLERARRAGPGSPPLVHALDAGGRLELSWPTADC
jgi:hypothetical protein